MKILVIGDPHGSKKIKKIPIKDIDLILIPGDIGKADLARKRYFENIKRKRKGLPELEENKTIAKKVHNEIHNSTINILKYLSKYAPVYTIQGNVGIPTKPLVREASKKYKTKFPCTRDKLNAMKKVKLVKNQLRNIKELKIGFLEYFIDNSWIKEFQEKDKKRIKKAKKDTAKAKKILKKFKKIDILVCHQPPYKILDKVTNKEAPKHYRGKNAGSKVILNYIKKYQPKYVICGHIHEAKGKKKLGKTTIINAGSDGDYLILDTEKNKIIKSNFFK